MNTSAKTPSRLVSCPACGGDSVYSTTNPYRPFCCARCKGLDLGAWASEQFRLSEVIPGSEPGLEHS
ncbi:MAG: DNA gyrase inhibitor YacG [Hydrogenophaga sp.]